MAKKHTGNRQEERAEIASEVEEALSGPPEESVETIAEPTVLPSELLGENEPAETAGAELHEEHAEAGAGPAGEGPEAAGAEPRRPGLGDLVGGLIHRGVYSGCYGLSYGLTFGALLAGHLIPEHSAVAEGLRDGAAAARQALEGGLRSEYPGEETMAGTA